jgi:aspartate/methionine/tyrosine aminotransferase
MNNEETHPDFQYKPIDKVKKYLNTTILAKLNELNKEIKGLNVGQGFPNFGIPEFLTEALIRRAAEPDPLIHQYRRNQGCIQLITALAKYHEPTYKRQIDPMTEILVSHGAAALLNYSCIAFLEPGDELISFEGFYDIYNPFVDFTGAKLRGVPLIPPKARDTDEYKDINNLDNIHDTWTVDFKLLRETVNEKTKLIIVNTPNNPTGKILSNEELIEISNIIKKYPRIIVIMDEVYEPLIYGKYKSLPKMIHIPGMWERTISVYSVGKLFNLTGSRTGWCVGAANLVKAVSAVHQYCSFCVYEPHQLAIADAFGEIHKPYKGYNSYLDWLNALYKMKRNLTVSGLANLGKENLDFNFWLPEAGYFLIVELKNKNHTTKYRLPGDDVNKKYTNDYAYITKCAYERKVLCVPLTPFYIPEHFEVAINFVRIAYCKSDEVLKDVIRNFGMRMNDN